MTKKSTHQPGTEVEAASSASPQEHEDDLLIVPKGHSKTRFYLMVGLILFVGVMFVVPGAFMSTATGPGGEDVTYASWTRENGKKVELTNDQFISRKRDLRLIERFFRIFGLGQFDAKDDFDTVRFLLMEDIATQAGIRISDRDLGEAISLMIGASPDDPAAYRNWLARLGPRVTPMQFEDAFRRGLLVMRFRILLGATAMGVEPREIEEIWESAHQEYSFDYVEVPTADFAEAATAEVPDDEGLEAWFDALSSFDKASYHSELKWSADLAYVPLAQVDDGSFDSSLLLEKFPRPEDEDPDSKALDYYERVKHSRFRREEPLEDVEGPEATLLPFEEVEEICLKEAPVYYSVEDWHRELNKRLNDGTLVGDVNLSDEAPAVGLSFVAAGDPQTMTEWTEVEDVAWAGSRLPSMLRNLKPASITPLVTIEQGAFVIGELVEKLEPGLPPFEEIRDQVAEAWAEERQGELAVAALEEIRGGLGERPADPVPDPETGETPFAEDWEPSAEPAAFQAAAEALGHTARNRDFEERSFARRPGEEDQEELPVQPFLRMNPTFYTLEQGTVPEPMAARDGEHAYLIRFAGERDAPLDKMTPAEYWRNRSNLANAAVQSFFGRTYDSQDFLRERYGLYILERQSRRKKDSEEAPGT